jgi:hypothetical protein
MSTAQDILRAHRAPGRVLRERLGSARGERSALMLAMLSCGLIFVAQWPRLSREAWLAEGGPDFNALFMGALFGWLFVMPLVLYALALVVFWVLRALGRPVTAFTVRYALFWGLLVATPWFLLNGLVAGFIGPGPALTVTGIIALAALLGFPGYGLFTIAAPEPVT